MDSGAARDAAATLDAWRARGADRLDPVRFRLIEAMARRAEAYTGEARHVLDARVAALVAAYAGDLAAHEAIRETAGKAAGGQGNDGKAVSAAAQALPTAADSPLAGLLRHVARHDPATADAAAPSSARALPDELELLDYFRKTWTRLGTDRQLRRSQDQVPANAGPLNSSHLAHRALSRMRETAPGYLQQFLSYLDTLAWLEQMGNPAASAKDGAPAGAARGGRSKAR